jgi:hypothetical protein
MPGGDRTGPVGQGPRTGRGLGFCAGFDNPGYMNQGWGKGFGGGRGWGRGFGAGRGGHPWGGGRGRVWGGGRGRRFWWRGPIDDPYYADFAPPYGSYQPPMTKEEEMEELKAQAEYFKSALDNINKRINELGDTEKGKS